VRCILESDGRYFNHRVTVLAGGVGGARMARALRSIVAPGLLSIVVNVGDNTERYGVHIAADPDTVLYTLSGRIGPHGWGRADDTTHVMSELRELGVDTTFMVGDKDFALCARRAQRLAAGEPLSAITADFAHHFGIADVALIPASDDDVATVVETATQGWLDFQTYFVDRHHADDVTAVAYRGTPGAKPAPGVLDAIIESDVLVVAPSNPPLSIWPILAIDGVFDAVAAHHHVVAVSPLFDGKPLKGPTDAVMRGIGLSRGTRGILEAYEGLVNVLWIDQADQADNQLGDEFGVEVRAANTRLDDTNGPLFAKRVVEAITRHTPRETGTTTQ
jgi:LPPG:FO 2-phospho-L-lactate transferase